jgi:hypothetical protein
VDKPEGFDEDQALLHDEFCAIYWDWINKRSTKDGQLNLLDIE